MEAEGRSKIQKKKQSAVGSKQGRKAEYRKQKIEIEGRGRKGIEQSREKSRRKAAYCFLPSARYFRDSGLSFHRFFELEGE